MKRFILTLSAMTLCACLYAQPEIIKTREENKGSDKTFTMEQAVLGTGIRPENAYYAWRPNTSELTSSDGKRLIATGMAEGDTAVIIGLEELNSVAGTEMDNFPPFSWKSENEIIFSYKSEVYAVDVNEKVLTDKFTLPQGAANVTPNGGRYYAFTVDNNLYVCDGNGNVIPVTEDTDPNIVNGQTVSRNEFGIWNGIFWAESGKEQYQAAFFEAADPKPDNQEEIKGMFENLKKDRPFHAGDVILDPDQRFYILSLAPNAARLSVRFFYQDSFGNILKNLAAHYERMSIVKPSWENRELMGIRDMLAETVNQNSKDKSPVPNMAALVLQAILSGAGYPASLYTDVLIRIRAEQGRVTWGRAGIIKAYLIRNANWKEGESYMGLKEESRDTAYVLGRLFSVLESIQMDANPGIKATIRDRYFNSACATPASIFPVLVKLKNSHMKKLEREKGSAKGYYEKLLTEIMEKLDEYPRRLTLEEQGKFILGYYHQVQKKYEKREEK